MFCKSSFYISLFAMAFALNSSAHAQAVGQSNCVTDLTISGASWNSAGTATDGQSWTTPGKSVSMPVRGGPLLIDFKTSKNCTWNMSDHPNWIYAAFAEQPRIALWGLNTLQLTVPLNTWQTDRTGYIVINGQTLTVHQKGQPGCSYKVTAQTAPFDSTGRGVVLPYSTPSDSVKVAAKGGIVALSVTAPQSCLWKINANPSFIKPYPYNVPREANSGNTTINLTVPRNTTGRPRWGKIMLAGQRIYVYQVKR